ncbi:MAG: two-component system sensor histidine kinase NtrB [Candidatus Rokuibacteriota bacterium]
MRELDVGRLLLGVARARLGLAAVLLVAMPLLPADFVPGWRGDLLALAFVVVLATSIVLLTLRSEHPRRLAWLACLLDVAVATAVVAATGGARSMFVFLYVLVVTVASVLLSRAGGLAIAAVSTLLFTALAVGRTLIPFGGGLQASEEGLALDLLTLFLNAGTFLVVAILAGDLAERYQATRRELVSQRKDLSDLQTFTDVIMRSMGAGLIALDRAHAVTALNPAAESITGLSRREAIGRTWGALFGDAVPLARVEAAIRETPTASPRRETLLRRPDGGQVPVRLTFSTLRSADSEPLGLVAVCEDLSEMREMEARMRQADRLATLGRMAANIAHEIRNPLASLTGAVEALRGKTMGEDARQRLADIVQHESRRLNGIIKSFLEYTRPAPLVLTEVDVTQVIDDVLTLLEHRELPPGLEIVRDLPGRLPWGIDAQQFRQALWNLCLNAVEAMPGGGELRVSAAAVGGRLGVRVSDTGCGIETVALPHVFEPFFSTKPGGSGLGLALVHRIICDHDGHIEIRPTVGGGTTMLMVLPGRAA